MNKTLPILLAALSFSGCDDLEPGETDNPPATTNPSGPGDDDDGGPNTQLCDFHCFQPDRVWKWPSAFTAPLDRDGNPRNMNLAPTACSATPSGPANISLSSLESVNISPVSCPVQPIANVVQGYTVCDTGGTPSADLNSIEQGLWNGFAGIHGVNARRACEEHLTLQGCQAGNLVFPSVGAQDICQFYVQYTVEYDMRASAPTSSPQPDQELLVTTNNYECDYLPFASCP